MAGTVMRADLNKGLKVLNEETCEVELGCEIVA